MDIVWIEAANLLFDNDSYGDQSAFEGFGEENLENLEEEAPRRVRIGCGSDALLDVFVHGPEELAFINDN